MNSHEMNVLLQAVRNLEDAQMARWLSERELQGLRDEIPQISVRRMREEYMEARDDYNRQLNTLAGLITRLRSPGSSHAEEAMEEAISEQLRRVTSARLGKVTANHKAWRARERRDLLEEMITMKIRRLERERALEAIALENCHSPMIELAKAALEAKTRLSSSEDGQA